MKRPKRNTSNEAKEWTAVGFLDQFMRIHKTVDDRSFAFLLGAGASITSNIPDAGTLARRWVEELYGCNVEDTTKTSIEDWATAENLGIQDFSLDRVAAFYPQVYDKRFGDDPELGYAYLEDAMSSAEPNIGYSILAKVLEKTRHKVVITTNFDNLVADALSIYTDTFPLVCGHESLTRFVRSRLRRPLVAKIHRDLLLAPKSDVDATSKLDERWANVLRTLLKDYTPIAIGYGGNDGSLMDFLEQLESGQIQGGIYWCYHRTGGKPGRCICNLVAKHRGRLIPILGFDEFMLQLGERLGYKPLADEIDTRAKGRVKRYRDQWKQFQKRLAQPAEDAETEKVVKPVREALAATVKRETGWWSWELKAQAEPDPDKQETIYRQGLAQFPESAELTGNFALFMDDVRKGYDEAERLYRRALELDPDDATYAGNFAVFLKNVRKNYDEAERLYRRALELNPDDADNNVNFAIFLWEVRKNYDEAERLYRRALELDPDDATYASNFAVFMDDIRKGYDEAELLYKRALELGPDDATYAGNFAVFMDDVRKDYDEAERLYRRTLELDPDHAINTGNFANFLWEVRKDYDEAERLYKRSLELDPDNANTTGNFAGFLLAQKRLEEAKDRIAQAFALNKGEVCNVAAEILLYWCLIARMEGCDDTPGVDRLKSVLAEGFERGRWSFEQVFEAARDSLTSEELAFYLVLGDAILDPEKMGELEQFERWNQIEPIPIDQPWDM
jgi:tetratricopeptide (TPR) repeat protein